MKLNKHRIQPLLLLAAALFINGCAHVQSQPLFPQAPGMCSYTYRNEFKKDVPGTLDQIKALGITDLEFSSLFGQTAAQMRQWLDARGMVCSSFGVGYDDLFKKTDEVAANAKTLGAKFVRVAWLPNRQPFTLELAKQTAAEFNRVGKQLREQHGLTFCYHNHGYEFVPHGDGTLFDVLVAETNPQDVSFELDILWAHFPGADPAALLTKHGSRFKLMHLKDLKQGVKGDLSGKTSVENDVALGTGQIDLPAVLIAARKAGVQHYYIEDESPNTITQVPQTIAYLKGLKQ
ncbi:MAG: sugar phosphate isomerase/epimerase [Verrucomicrobiales bacterium]|nr:sugar phosphate isomerase/epimerase [Verrucomicrobiales bacterium]